MTCERCGLDNSGFDSMLVTTLPVNFPAVLCLRCQRDYTQQTIIAPTTANAALYANLTRSQARLTMLGSMTARMDDYMAVADYRVAAEKAASIFSKTFLETKPSWAIPPSV